MENLNYINQFGQKSVYVENSTGNIHIHNPNGEVRIISPESDEGIKQLLLELGGHRELLNEILTALKGKKIPHALTAPPIYPIDFIGRDKDLENLRNRITGGDNFLLLVNGQGGIGKTTLAARYYHDFKKDYYHIAWLVNDKDLKTSILYLKRELGFGEELNNLPQDEQLNLIIAKLSELEKPSLLIIDNVNEIDDLKENYLLLSTCSNLHILLTTRISNFDTALTYKIDGLLYEYAKTLFVRHYPKHNSEEDTLLQTVIENVERNTLVIELLAKNLCELNKLEPVYTLQKLVDDLHKSLINLSKSKQISTAYHTNSNKLRTERPEDIVMAMYDFSELTDEEKKVISVFSVLPGEPISYHFFKACFSDEEIDIPLLSMAKRGWVDFDENEGLFKANQVIRDVTFVKQRERIVEDCKPAIQLIADYLGGDDILHHEQHYVTVVLARYAESILHRFEQVNSDLVQLYQNLGNYYFITGETVLSLRLYDKLHPYYTLLIENNTNDEYAKYNLAISYSKLGETHTALGNLDKALNYFEEETMLFEQLYEAYPQNVDFKNGLAISYSKLGQTHTALGNLDKALNYFEEETMLFEQLYEAYPQNVDFKNGLAISYAKLGETHTTLGNLDKALNYFEEYSAFSKELYEAYPQNVDFKNGLAISYEKLGETHTALGNLDKALNFFEVRSKLGKELYEAYPQNVAFKNGLAISYAKLGVFYRDQRNDKATALLNFMKAKQLWSELIQTSPNNRSFNNYYRQINKDISELQQ